MQTDKKTESVASGEKPRMLFLHDNRFVLSEGNYYAATGFTRSLFTRYLQSFSSVTVIARQEASRGADISKYDKLNNKQVKFNCIGSLDAKRLIWGDYRRVIRSEVKKADVIIARLPSIIGTVGVLEARKQKKPYLVELVACRWDSLWNYGKLAYKVLAPVLFLIDRMIVRNAPNVLYVSEKFLQKRYPTGGRSVGCSDVELAPRDASRLDRRFEKIDSYGTDATLKLGTVGALDMKYKGYQYVIQAISELKSEQGIRLEYHLVGSGDTRYVDAVSRKYNVSDAVKVHGPLPHVQVTEFIGELDIYIQPSNAESHGRVILEAFEAACPTIGSSTGGIPELVSPDYVFERKNVDDLKQKIMKMISSKDGMKKEAVRNFEKLLEFDAQLLDKKRHSFYAGALGDISESRG